LPPCASLWERIEPRTCSAEELAGAAVRAIVMFGGKRSLALKGPSSVSTTPPPWPPPPLPVNPRGFSVVKPGPLTSFRRSSPASGLGRGVGASSAPQPASRRPVTARGERSRLNGGDSSLGPALAGAAGPRGAPGQASRVPPRCSRPNSAVLVSKITNRPWGLTLSLPRDLFRGTGRQGGDDKHGSRQRATAPARGASRAGPAQRTL
jgi:hypothetical protein